MLRGRVCAEHVQGPGSASARAWGGGPYVTLCRGPQHYMLA